MSTPRELLAAIEALSLPGPIRILNLSGDQERVISLSGMRRALPDRIGLLSGPGCAASICPAADLYQAIQLSERHPLTLLVAENMLRLPLGGYVDGPHTLLEAKTNGADVRVVSAPIEALLIADAEPQREMVLFVAGFETLLAPLAGMVLDGLPDNLSLLLCGRRVQPLIAQILTDPDPGFDALLLPGNRCAVTGTDDWEMLVADFHVPAAVAGYTSASILAAVHSVLQQFCAGEAQVDNCCQVMVRPEGNAMARDQLYRVFDLVDGGWRGVGRVAGTAYRLRHAYGVLDAAGRYPDYRAELRSAAEQMPPGCQCAAVVLGQKQPADCQRFFNGCNTASPYGPCMASEDGTCFVRVSND